MSTTQSTPHPAASERTHPRAQWIARRREHAARIGDENVSQMHFEDRGLEIGCVCPMRNHALLLTGMRLAILLVSLMAAICARGDTELKDYRGTMNHEMVIGLTLVHDSGRQLHGSYFYKKYLKDIPLKGAYTSDRDIELHEYDESGAVRAIFHLHFAERDDRFKDQQLQEEVLVGSWNSGTRNYPVYLAWEGISIVSDESLRYRILGVEDSQAFEREAQKFYFAVMRGDKAAAAQRLRYPTRAFMNGDEITLRSPREFLLRWNEIFTPEYVACLKKGIPHNMFVNSHGAMIGDGAVWLDKKGLVVTLNSCIPPQGRDF
jgi:hypothetical protein